MRSCLRCTLGYTVVDSSNIKGFYLKVHQFLATWRARGDGRDWIGDSVVHLKLEQRQRYGLEQSKIPHKQQLLVPTSPGDGSGKPRFYLIVCAPRGQVEDRSYFIICGPRLQELNRSVNHIRFLRYTGWNGCILSFVISSVPDGPCDHVTWRTGAFKKETGCVGVKKLHFFFNNMLHRFRRSTTMAFNLKVLAIQWYEDLNASKTKGLER